MWTRWVTSGSNYRFNQIINESSFYSKISGFRLNCSSQVWDRKDMRVLHHRPGLSDPGESCHSGQYSNTSSARNLLVIIVQLRTKTSASLILVEHLSFLLAKKNSTLKMFFKCTMWILTTFSLFLTSHYFRSTFLKYKSQLVHYVPFCT